MLNYEFNYNWFCRNFKKALGDHFSCQNFLWIPRDQWEQFNLNSVRDWVKNLQSEKFLWNVSFFLRSCIKWVSEYTFILLICVSKIQKLTCFFVWACPNVLNYNMQFRHWWVCKAGIGGKWHQLWKQAAQVTLDRNPERLYGNKRTPKGNLGMGVMRVYIGILWNFSHLMGIFSH